MKYRGFFPLLLTALLILSICVTGAAAIEKPLTQAQSDFTAEGALGAGCSESALGDLLADAALEETGAQMAILPAGVMTGTLEKGAVFQSDVERVVPENAELVTARLTVADLAALLEQGVSKLSRNESEQIDATSAWDGFPQVGGFSWEYDVSAPEGERLQYICYDGQELDLTDCQSTYTVVSVPALFDGSMGYPACSFERTGTELRQALRDYCSARDSIAVPASRSTAIGTASYPIKDRLPVMAVVIVGVLIALVASIPKWKEEKHFSFRGK